MSNCEDAYGFPPYAAIEGSLRRRNGSDLKQVERAIVASALSGLPASLLRSETMDWSCRLPDVVSRWTPTGRFDQGRTCRSRIVAQSTLSARAVPGERLSARGASRPAAGAAGGDTRPGAPYCASGS